MRQTHNDRRCSWLRTFAMGALLCLSTLGCHRYMYRQAADCDAYRLVRQKANDPRWPLDDFHVYPDPASRMFDPFSPDCPPLPPDDPTAHQLMHCVYCMEGSPCWHHRGDADAVENPAWCTQLTWGENGRVQIDPRSAMQLALLHSPEYQTELEDLYISALDVSFERFQFDTQFFGGYTGFLTLDGRERGFGESKLDLSTTNWQAKKLFATGAELVVGLANSMIWQFSGPNTHTATTLLDFSLVQPLLRGAGRKVVLQELTQAERDLLANVRQMERFRRGFYLDIFLGRDAAFGPARGGVGIPVTGVSSATASGLLGLLQTQQTIRNQRANLAALESSVAQLESFYIGGRIDFFQVQLTRQAFFNAQSSLLNAELQYANRLDAFKISLGLPPSLEIDIDDSLLEPFQLVDPQAVDLQNRMTLLQRNVGKAITELLDILAPLPVDAAETDDAQADQPDADDEPAVDEPGDVPSEEASNEDQMLDLLERLQQQLQRTFDIIKKASGTDLEQVGQDIEKLSEAIPGRLSAVQRLRRQLTSVNHQWHVERIASDISRAEAEDLLPFDADRLQALPDQLQRTLEDVELVFERLQTAFEEIDAAIDNAKGKTVDDQLLEQLREQVFTRLPDELNKLAANVLSLTLVQARARTENVTLVPVEVSWKRAYSTAKEYRRDWMNARAALVDAWRLIDVTANDVRSQFDLVVSGDIGNTGDNPLRLRDSTGQLRFGVEFDSALTRLAERNTYREALIEYQRTRRRFYRFRDAISINLRTTIRTMDINQLNFEFRRAAIEVAIAQVELTRLRLSEPPQPGQPSQFSVTTARDLVTALSELLNVQNDFLGVWVSHESLRRSFDFDMGTMELDPDGVWIDPGQLTDESLPVDDDEAGWEYCEQIDNAKDADSSQQTVPVDVEDDRLDQDESDAVERLPDPDPGDDEASPIPAPFARDQARPLERLPLPPE